MIEVTREEEKFRPVIITLNTRQDLKFIRSMCICYKAKGESEEFRDTALSLLNEAYEIEDE